MCFFMLLLLLFSDKTAVLSDVFMCVCVWKTGVRCVCKCLCVCLLFSSEWMFFFLF